MKEMFDYLENSVELLVLLQYGKVPFSCKGCTVIAQKENNCTFFSSTHSYTKSESVWYSKLTHKEYFSCPVSMIPQIIFDLHETYSFIKEFKTQMNPDTTSSIFWWFVKTYKRKTTQIEAEIHRSKPTK